MKSTEYLCYVHIELAHYMCSNTYNYKCKNLTWNKSNMDAVSQLICKKEKERMEGRIGRVGS
jgi:hypothetical protein